MQTLTLIIKIINTMKKQFKTAIFLAILLCNSIITIAQNDADTIAIVTKSLSILIDGAVRNIESAGSNDIISSGLVGLRYDNERVMFKISISAYSTADTLFGTDVKIYSNSILNTSVSKSGLGSLSFELIDRFFSRQGYALYLAKKKYNSDYPNANKAAFNKWLIDNGIYSLNVAKKYLGLRTYVETNNTIWKNDSDIVNNANVANFGAMITFSYYDFFGKFPDINITCGAGLTTRYIFNDLGQDDEFRKSILGTTQKFFWGPEFFVGLKLNNAYARFTLPILLSNQHIKGLTGGQPIVTIGVSADIPYKDPRPKTLKEVIYDGGIDNKK